MNWSQIKQWWSEFCAIYHVGKCNALMAVDVDNFLNYCREKQTEMMVSMSKEEND